MEVLSVKNLSYFAQDRISGKIKKEILYDINFSVKEGEIIGIAGESGSGKTTLAKLLSGIIKPSSGIIELNDNRRNNKINPVQILFQNTGELIHPLRKIGLVLKETLERIKRTKEKLDIQTEELLSSVGLNKDFLNKRGYELSGGEQQRAALARLLAVNPKLLILDEPFSAQDFESINNLVGLIKKLNEELRITFICISHDLIPLKKMCSRIMILYEGKIVELDETKKIFESPENSYTKFLIKSSEYKMSEEDLRKKNF